jgi:hypothetical protein
VGDLNFTESGASQGLAHGQGRIKLVTHRCPASIPKFPTS